MGTKASRGETKGEEQLEKQEREVKTKDLEEALAALCDPTVTKLDVSNAKFGVEETEKIAEALQHENCRVTDLLLYGNKIGAEGVEHLVHALQHENCRVTGLGLNGNNIGAEAVEHLVRALQHENCRVTDLGLNGNDIGGLGFNNIDFSVLDRLQPFLDANKIDQRRRSRSDDLLAQLREKDHMLKHEREQLNCANEMLRNYKDDNGWLVDALQIAEEQGVEAEAKSKKKQEVVQESHHQTIKGKRSHEISKREAAQA